MADAAVQFLLGNLQQLLTHHISLIKDAHVEVHNLERDLNLFNAFLKDSIKLRREDNRLRELTRQIRDVVYKSEDIIDAYVTQASVAKSKNYFERIFKKPVDLHSIAQEVAKVSAEVNKIYGDKGKFNFANTCLQSGGPYEEHDQTPTVRQENVVGFEDEAKKLSGYLREESDEQLDVISIIGMPGLGKTTLAWKIFCDPDIEYEFPTRIWLYVSQEFTQKDVFLQILEQIPSLTVDEKHNTSYQKLAETVADYLERGNFLIIMDDVWRPRDWDKLKIALPKRNKMCKVMITSRNEEVAWYANPIRGPHKLRFLTPDESWLLLRLEAFRKPDCPPELEVHGRIITEQCGGLPLAIVVIGGILVKKFSASNDLRAKEKAWEKVSQSVSRHINEDPDKRMEKIIALSYDTLPFHLRACFLYLGMFPEEIPVWKLIRMWIAEGFIQHKSGSSLEDTAETYLEDLINRNLVKIDKMKADGKVKTCRIHGMLREFCRNEAGNENFLQEIKKSDNDGDFEPRVDDVHKYRRLCLHSNVSKFLSLNPRGPLVRSFVCFSKEDIDLLPQNCSAIPAAFKLLRVLDTKPLRYPKALPTDMYHLVHLRYIALSINLDILPKAFAKLWNIETLIVDTTSRTLEIKADIWQLIQLRHLKTNATTTLPEIYKDSKAGDKLQTLGTITPQNCTAEVFDRAQNLKKLGIRGQLSLLLDGNKSTGSFDSFAKLSNLEKLKLLNDPHPRAVSEAPLVGLPTHYIFPPNLKSLTLSRTWLDWSQMSNIFVMLHNLEVLKLKENAFMGKRWETADGIFRKLEVLHIGRTDLVVWKTTPNNFPRLRCLKLRNCEELIEIPIELAQIQTLQVLNLYRAKLAAASARNIRSTKEMIHKEQTTKVSALNFKLFIYPPVE